ncbi:hypothetical protein H5V45_14105 [Nocardioides sp. KIGAM211]|uniref:DUF3352 domain-containing protein n=1 Tax=Nocardioides luti TaxID=2761101 RepID=A0A7X0VCP9_9ACTN|nr:hypothetical protein [Nocardioides luti]MBB6628453.1 hypothetical protein [Nocardioides luti]
MRKRLIIVAAVVVALALVAAGLLWWRSQQGTDLERAAALAPPDAERLSWTDWAGVRRELGVSLDADSGTSQLRKFLDQGYDADLTSGSALVQSAPVLQAKFGFSPASVDWELFSQSPQGAVVILHLPESTDFGDLEANLTDLGFTRPSSDTGVWQGGDLLSSIGSDLTPELQFIALDAERGLVLTSDEPTYLAQAVKDSDGGDGVADDLRQVIAASGDPLSAAVYSGAYTCEKLAMSQADPGDQEQADQLLRDAGKVNPVTGFAMSVQPDRDVRVVLGFENDDQARTNADSRAALAAGPAPGQGGDFADRFSVRSVTADGSLVTMDLKPVEGAYVLSDLSNGPVLFATC